MALAMTAGAAEPVELTSGGFVLRFAADGRCASLKTLPDGAELLDVSSPGLGFFLRSGPRGGTIPLSDLRLTKDGKLLAGTENGSQQVTFSVKSAEKYLAIRIERLHGIPIASNFSLHFEMIVKGAARVMALDYMTVAHNGHNRIGVDFNYIWNRNEDDPLGGFALYCPKDDDNEDDTILRIWVAENLPHPKVEGKWDLAGAKKFIAEWQRLYADQSQFYIEATNLDDLYAAAEYARKAEAREVYIFTNTWHEGGDFWPDRGGNWEVRRSVFPRGEKDLRAFADHLARSGMRLKIHWVSGGIGFHDPKYVGSRPDRRLASWGSGKLAEQAGPKDTTLLFEPAAGVELPFLVPPSARGEVPYRLPAMEHIFGFNYVRIDDELVRVGRFEDTDGKVWKLAGCTRGLFDTNASSHPGGSEAVGLVAPYNQNFVPDNNSSLLDEMAKGFAGFVNRCRIANVIYDGFEIHSYNGQWGCEKFAAKVYAALDHPVCAGSSSGRPPTCHIEYRLNSTKRLLRGMNTATHGSHSAPIILDSPSRAASALLDAHFCLMKGVAGGSGHLSVTRPEPMFGITLQTLKAHGLTDRILQAVRNYKAVHLAITDEQRARMLAALGPPERTLPDASHDPASAVIWEARQDKGRCLLVPVTVLRRRAGDIKHHSWQEHGPIATKQYLRPGEKITLENPNSPQPAKFIIRVLSAFDHAGEGNVDLLPPVEKIENRGDVAFAPDRSGGLSLSMTNDRGEPRVNVDSLPTWRQRLDMTQHRGIGAYVTGDGSGAMLLVQIPGRDYVMPIDFTGRRYVEIPNGEVAWADGRWGWRVGTHRADYARVDRLSLGFGLVPPQTSCKVKVEQLRALREIAAELVDPVIRVASGSLRVAGAVRSGEYLQYDGAAHATVFDKNWNELRRLKVAPADYVMPTGSAEVSIATDQDSPRPWLEVQFITEGEPIVVPEKR